MKIYISHSSKLDYERNLYEPIRESAVFSSCEFFLPHEKERVAKKTRRVIENSDAVIAETSLASTGQGIELGWADMKHIPILCINKPGGTPSSSLKYVCTSTKIYKTTQELIAAIDSFINTL